MPSVPSATPLRASPFLLVVVASLLWSGTAYALNGSMGGGGSCGGGGGGSGGGMGGGGGGMGGGGTGVIDPPSSGAFVDPPEMPFTIDADGAVAVRLEAKIATVPVNGVSANLYTYNGSSPGPTIRVRRGDHLKVRLVNSLPATEEKNLLGFTRNVTNLHTHGLHVSPEEPADAAHLSILPGQAYDYEYDLKYQEPGALTFYHGHSHGVSAEQYWAGMVGAIVIEDPTPVLSGFETHLMILKDLSIAGAEPTPHDSTRDYMHGLEGNVVMVNGKVNPTLASRPGQVQRWRVLNASNARFYKLALQDHLLHVIGTDGGLLDKPYAQPYVVLSPGERVDLLVKTNGTKGSYKLLALPYARMGMMTSAQVTLLTVSNQGSALRQSMPTSINPDAVRLDVDLSMAPHKTFTLSMSMGRAYINGQDFDVEPAMTMSNLGSYEVWEIVNQSNMDHPWHQHVNAAQVLSVAGGDSAYSAFFASAPAWKDTVLVPKGGRVRLLVPVMDWPGMTMFHCHILEHEDIGMMGMWHIMDGGMGGM